MTTFRTHKETGRFMILDKTAIHDTKLSLKAKGLLVTMLEKPDDWIFYESELTKSCKDGRDSVRSGLEELIKAGYLKRERGRDEKGRLGNYDYDVYETPHHIGNSNIGKTNIGETSDGKSNIGKSNTTNNNLTNNNNTNNNLTNNDLNDLNDKREESGLNHTNQSNQTNHLTDHILEDLQEEKEILTENLPPLLSSYLMKYELDEIQSIKSCLLKAKSKFFEEVAVEQRLTIEDIEEALVKALKRINAKRKLKNESIKSLEPYIFQVFKNTFHSNVSWTDDDERIDIAPGKVLMFTQEDFVSGY